MNKEKVLQLLRSYKSEALNPRNDGWVQSHYVNELKAINSELLDLLNQIDKKNTAPKKRSELQNFVGVIDDGC